MYKQLCISEFLGCNCIDVIEIKCLSQDIPSLAHRRTVRPGRERERLTSLSAGPDRVAHGRGK